jgi:rod shape determining protein RodA
VSQLQALGAGALLAAVLVCIDYRAMLALAPLWYLGSIAMLLLVLSSPLGTEAKGAMRWLKVGPVMFQPSEFAKIGLIYMLAWYIAKCGPRIRRAHWFLLAFVIAGAPIALVEQQPNLGTALSMTPIVFALLWAAGCQRWHILLLVCIGLAAIPIAWQKMEGYQRERIHGWLDPESQAQGAGWQPIQTKIAVGSGKMTGKGFMNASQTWRSYLPEHHTDFVFSLYAEEQGFMGAAAVIGVFAALFMRCLYLGALTDDIGGRLLIVGVVSVLAFHVFANIAVTIGLLPVTGLPLPFFSYGRSFYLTTMAAVGVVLSVQVRQKVFVQ